MQKLFMQLSFKEYPAVPWEPDWRFCSDPEDAVRFCTRPTPGQISAAQDNWVLQLTDPALNADYRLFHNGLSIQTRRKRKTRTVILFAMDDGILTGSADGLPLPTLLGPGLSEITPGEFRVQHAGGHTLLLCKGTRFALVTGNLPEAPALEKAEQALAENFQGLLDRETERRRPVTALFGINPRHNPPVALAAETLQQRLRGRTPALHGIWSVAEGFETETFSLNELYPLCRAWALIHPGTALDLIQTALSLQQAAGGFPAWVGAQGAVSSAAPWPLLIQSFETAWTAEPDPALLRKHLPALRKYIQWALRYFDPHRDHIPAWQSEAEVFVPGSFERGKATPDLTVMLLGEIEALTRLCRQNEDAQAAADPLAEEHDQLMRTLTTVFRNPESRAFSNVWKDGHLLHEPSFASFTPLLLPGLPAAFKAPLLEDFEETHGFPGRDNPSSWKKEQIDDTAALPAIHQFTAFEALRRSDDRRALLMLFIRRAREGFAVWFEHERIDTARREQHTDRPGKHIFALGPVTAALILTTQDEFTRQTKESAPVVKTLQRWIHRLRFDAADVRIILGALVAILLVHLLYNIAVPANADARMAEAALNYRQGRLTETLQICRKFPAHPLSSFLRANLFMITENPAEAEKLYLQTLHKETESPSALFGYALALQMNENFDLAIRRYNDFIDIHEARLSRPAQTDLIDLAYDFLRLAEEGFSTPPKWKRAYMLPEMNDLGL